MEVSQTFRPDGALPRGCGNPPGSVSGQNLRGGGGFPPHRRRTAMAHRCSSRLPA